MRKTSKKIKFLSEPERRELFKTIELDKTRHRIRNRAMFAIIKYCALRASEVSLIKISDYDPVHKSIFIHRLKGSRSNTLVIVDPYVLKTFEEYYWLRKHSATSTNEILFLSQKGTPISRKTIDRIMRNYCLDTTIPDDKHHTHVLKHTRAMELIDYPGIELRDVQWWLGHKNIQNTMIYLDYSIQAMNLLFQKIALEEGRGEIFYAHSKTESECYVHT